MQALTTLPGSDQHLGSSQRVASTLRLRSITDEAWMETRRGEAGDRERALVLLDAARGPFESIGMPGWQRRAEELRQQLGRF